MEIDETLIVKNRNKWRDWLIKNHDIKKAIWIVYFKKHSKNKSIPYDDAVEEALCFGWIDGIVKKIDDETYAQRFTPRRKNSNLSELNKQRVNKMIREGKMTEVGVLALNGKHKIEFQMPEDILNVIKCDTIIWDNFVRFPESYKKIRIAWIDDARDRPEMFRKRLDYFLKMTSKNKLFGTMVD